MKKREKRRQARTRKEEKVGKCDQRGGLPEKIRPQYYNVHSAGAASAPASAVATTSRARATQTRRNQKQRPLARTPQLARLHAARFVQDAPCSTQASFLPCFMHSEEKQNTVFVKMTQMGKYCIENRQPSRVQEDPAELESRMRKEP